MVTRNAIFKYKTIKGPLHKLPVLIKLILLFALSITAFIIPSLWLGTGIIIAMITAFIGGITFREQLTDLKPAFFYVILMYSLSIFSNIFSLLSEPNSLSPTPYSLLPFIIPHPDYLKITLRLILIIQFSAMFFRTTSTLELREVIKLNIIVLFLSFIPEIFEIWNKINLSWKARGGQNGLKKIKSLVFVLISCCFEKASVKAKAFELRRR